MRNEFLLCSVFALLVGCSSSRLTPQQKVVKSAWTAQKVHEAIENKKMAVEINYVIPFRAGMKHLDYGYDIRLSGDTLYSYLPYYGRAYNIPYGGGKGLVFNAPIQDYAVSNPKKVLTKMDIYVENDEDRYAYMMEIFDNGQVNLLVRAQKREQILFRGKLVIKDENKQ